MLSKLQIEALAFGLETLGEVATGFFFFVLGACIGSFLNVVAYRVPRGCTLIGTSACPRCGTPIDFRDNIPIFGWIKLRGKCRACRQPVSSRYCIVELTTAIIVLALAIVELAYGGSNLPIERSSWPGFACNLRLERPQLIIWFAVHASLMCLLIVLVLIEIDACITSWRIVLTFCAAVAVSACIAHGNGFSLYFREETVHSPLARRDALAEWLLGGAVGCALGWLLDAAIRRGSPAKWDGAKRAGATRRLAASLTGVGAVTGIAPVATIGVVVAFLIAIVRPLRRHGVTVVFIVTFLHILWWRHLDRWQSQGAHPEARCILIATAGVCAACVGMRTWRRVGATHAPALADAIRSEGIRRPSCNLLESETSHCERRSDHEC